MVCQCEESACIQDVCTGVALVESTYVESISSYRFGTESIKANIVKSADFECLSITNLCKQITCSACINDACLYQYSLSQKFLYSYYYCRSLFGNVIKFLPNLASRGRLMKNPSNNELILIVLVINVILTNIYCKHCESSIR